MYRFMDEEELEIQQINDLKMVHMYQLAGNDALAVYYGNNKQINLCSMDVNYNMLMETVLRLYSQCKTPDSIIMDPTTREMMNQAIDGQNCHTAFFNRIGKKYMNMEGSLSPAFASDGLLRQSLLPMLKYYIGQLYHMWELNVSFEPDPMGWRRNCVLKLKKGEDILILPVRMDFLQGNESRIIINNFLQDMCSIVFEISFREDRLYVWFESQDFELTGESIYEFYDDKVRAVTTIHVKGQVVYHHNEPIEILSAEDESIRYILDKKELLADAEIDITRTGIYRLPWKGLVLCSSMEAEAPSIHRTDCDMIYIDEYCGKLVMRQFSYSLIKNLSDGLKLRTDGAVMRKLYYGNDMQDVETFFLPVGYYSGWDYKQYLRNKYFYHTLEEVK